MTEERFWQRRTFESGTRQLEQQRAKSAAGATPLAPAAETHARQEERAQVLSECAELARLYEKRGANLGTVRFILQQRARDAWAKAGPLEPDEVETLGRVTPSSGSSGTAEGLTASAPSSTSPDEAAAPLTHDDWLGQIARMYDEVLRALGTPEPQSRKANPLRRVK